MPARRPTTRPICQRSRVVCVTTAAAVVLAGWAVGAQAAFEVRYERGLELTQSHDGQPRPVAVTCDPTTGEICVTESTSSSLHIFNAAGVETFQTGRFSGLAMPSDGAIDSEGRLVVVTTINGSGGTIVRLNVYGEPDGYLPEPAAATWYPDRLLITRDGHYLTVDSTAALLAKHDATTGALLWARSIGTLDQAIGRPAQMADGTFRVPGGELHSILIVAEDGTVTGSFGRMGTAVGRFVFPVAAAAGPQGSLLVLDRMRHKVMIFDAANTFVSEYGSIGNAPGRFYHPVSIATDGNGHLYVAQGFRGRVQVFNVLATGMGE